MENKKDTWDKIIDECPSFAELIIELYNSHGPEYIEEEVYAIVDSETY